MSVSRWDKYRVGNDAPANKWAKYAVTPEESPEQPQEQPENKPVSLREKFKELKKSPTAFLDQEMADVEAQQRHKRELFSNPSSWIDLAIGGAKGIGNLPFDVVNFPIQAGNWLNKTNAPTIPEPFEYRNEAQQTGGILSSLLNLPRATRAAAALAARPGEVAQNVASKVKPFTPTALKHKAQEYFGNMPELKAELARTENEARLAEAEAERAKGMSQLMTGQGTEAGAQLAAQRKRAELAALPEAEQPTMPVLSSRESGANLERTQEAHANAQEQLGQAEQAIRQHLNEGAAHDVRVAADVDRVLSAEKAGIQKQFNDVEKSLTSQKVHIPNPDETREIIEELKTYMGKVKPEESTLNIDPVRDLFSYTHKSEIPAVDFLKAIRSVRGYANDARRTAYTHGINQAERDAALARYNRLDDIADRMSSMLEKHIPAEDSDMLAAASKGWRERIVPLYRNRIYQNIHYKQQMPADIIKSLRGNEKGNLIIKDVIKKSPEILRNVVGQKYAVKPHELHNPGELLSEYLGEMPELQGLVQQHGNASRAAERAGTMVEQAERRHADVQKQEAEGFRAAEKQEAEAAKISEKRAKIQSEIDELDRQIPILRKSAERKDVGLKEHVAAQKKFDEAQKRRQNLLKWAVGGGATYVIGNKVLNRYTGS